MIIKIKSFFKENWKFLIFLAFFYAFMNYELPYVIYTPGGQIDMADRVSGDNTYDEAGSISMTYVTMVKGSIPFLGLSYLIPNWDIAKKESVTYDNTDFKETIEIDKIHMKEAISNAEEVAYKAAGIDYEVISNQNIVTFISKGAKTNLKHGDELLSIDGVKIESIKDVQEYLKDKSVGDTVLVKYIRNGKEREDEITLIDINGAIKAGIGIANISKYDTIFNIEVKTKSGESGPSGGLMTALEIYNQITDYDITRGMKIMGTGTIDKDGKVGEIGGVKYKLIGAVNKGADVFICPVDNYKEAQSVVESNNYDIKLITGNTFSEVLEKLKEI